MTAIQNRFSLSSLFLIAVAFAAYQSGRIKEQHYARSAKIAEADATGLRARSRELEQQARTWKRIALESRTLADGAGQNFRRWDLNTTSIRAANYTRSLDALGIKLLTVSAARELHILSNFSSELTVEPTDEFPRSAGIVQGGSREQELVERAGFREMPVDVLILLPPSLVEDLAAQELARATRMGLRLSQIEETSFFLGEATEHNQPIFVRSIRASTVPVSSK